MALVNLPEFPNATKALSSFKGDIAKFIPSNNPHELALTHNAMAAQYAARNKAVYAHGWSILEGPPPNVPAVLATRFAPGTEIEVFCLAHHLGTIVVKAACTATQLATQLKEWCKAPLVVADYSVLHSELQARVRRSFVDYKGLSVTTGLLFDSYLAGTAPVGNSYEHPRGRDLFMGHTTVAAFFAVGGDLAKCHIHLM